jgi:hypothetical protein
VSYTVSRFFSTLPESISLAIYLCCSMMSSIFLIFLFIP